MIDREQLKKRIVQYSRALDADKYKLHQSDIPWRKHILAGELPFLSHGTKHKVDFSNIDFTGPEVKNQEWRAQLNRYLWLGSCLKEDISGESDYFARVAVDSVGAFLDFRKGVHIPDKEFLWKELGDNTLSISIRLGKRYGMGWWGTLPFMRESVVTDEFLEGIYKESVIQVEFMIDNMTSCGNWRISQLSCLLFLGYIFRNSDWTDIAAKGLNEAFHTQVTDDGCHEEHTSGYHTWMATEYASFGSLASNLPELGLCVDRDKLVKMWEYTIISSCPDGQPVGLNDDVRWGYVNKANWPEKLAFALSTRNELSKEAGREPSDGIMEESRYFESAGQWFLKRNIDNEFSMLVFDATRYGGGHCHRAHNSISYYYGNKMLLLDPGTFNYERSDPFCEYGKQSLSHNTVSVDGLSQVACSVNEAISHIGRDCAFVFNNYSAGYSDGNTGIQGVHERLVFWYRNDICIINDNIIGSGNGFTANFNFLPCEYDFGDNTFITKHDDYNIMVKTLYSNTELDIRVHEASMDPIAGWLALDGHKLRGEQEGVSMHVSGKIRKERGTVVAYALVPFKGNNKPEASIENSSMIYKEEIQDIRSRIYNNAVCYRIQSGDRQYEIVSALLKYRHSRLHPSIGVTGDFTSDGKLAFVEKKKDEVAFAYLYDGTYLKYKDITLIDETEFGNYEKTF